MAPNFFCFCCLKAFLAIASSDIYGLVSFEASFELQESMVCHVGSQALMSTRVLSKEIQKQGIYSKFNKEVFLKRSHTYSGINFWTISDATPYNDVGFGSWH